MTEIERHNACILPNGCSLYTYFWMLPMESLEKFPENEEDPYLWSIANTPLVLEMQDYVIFWRRQEQILLKTYPVELLQQMSTPALRSLHATCLKHIPLWVYAGVAKRCLDILMQRCKDF